MDFLKKLFGGGPSHPTNSAQAAKRRLLEVVVHDRAEFPPGMVDQIREDIVAVVSRHIKIDRNEVTVNINNMGSKSVLSVDVPLLTDQSQDDGRVHGSRSRRRPNG